MIPQLFARSGVPMSHVPWVDCAFRLHRSRRWLSLMALTFGLIRLVSGQTASTGAVMGLTLDQSGAVLAGVTVSLARQGSSEGKSVTSDGNGRFAFLLLPPGTFGLHASKSNFKAAHVPELEVQVTETVRLEVHLQLAARVERAEVSSSTLLVQLDS